MAMVTKTITLTEQQDNWIKTQMRLGNRSDESKFFQEMIQDSLMRTQETEEHTSALREALLESERQGLSDMTVQDIVDSVRNPTSPA